MRDNTNQPTNLHINPVLPSSYHELNVDNAKAINPSMNQSTNQPIKLTHFYNRATVLRLPPFWAFLSKDLIKIWRKHIYRHHYDSSSPLVNAGITSARNPSISQSSWTVLAIATTVFFGIDSAIQFANHPIKINPLLPFSAIL